MPLPKFLLVPSLYSQLAEFRHHLSVCLWGDGGEIAVNWVACLT